MTVSRTPSLSEVLRLFGDRLRAEMRVCLPARVEKYDSSRQLVDVKPLVRDSIPDENGDQVTYSVPVIPNVPVVFPGAGGYRLTFPIAPGDTVALIFSDRSIDQWKAEGGEVEALDLREHALADAIAVPGLHDNRHPWTGARTDKATLGVEGGPQVHLGPSDVQLGAGTTPATEALLLASTYRTHEAILHSNTPTGLAGIFTSMQGVSVGPLAPLNAGFGALATAISLFESFASAYLSAIVKTK